MNSLPNILIVDDDEDNLFVLKAIIGEINANLIMALSGAEALEKTRGVELALAILDVRMQEMDGFELAVKLNEERLDDKVPILFLTACNNNEYNEYKGYGSGAVDFIYKPINIPVLLSKIKVFLDLYNQKLTIIKESTILNESTDKLIQLNQTLTESEGRLEDIIFSMADWLWEVDENGVYTYCSDHVSDLLGYLPKEVLGKTPFDFMSMDEGRSVQVLFSEIVVNKSFIKDLVNWNIRKDGKKICLLTNGVPIFDKDGNLKGYRGVDRDITHQIELEESLRSHRIELEMQNDELKQAKDIAEASSQKYTDLYNFAPSGFFTLSSNSEIQELNYSGSLMLGISNVRSRLVDNRFNSYVSKDTLPVFNDFLEKVFQSKDKETCEIVLETEDFPPRIVHIEGVVQINGKQCNLIIVDITKLKRTEDKLSESEKQYGILFNAIDEGFCIIEMIFDETQKPLDYRFLQVNPAFERQTGLVNAQGKCMLELAPKHEAYWFVIYGKIALTGQSLRFENYAEELQRWYDVFAFRIGEPEKRQVAILFMDITERRLTEQLLKVSEKKYKTMLNSSPDGILLIDMEGIITEVSDIGLELFGADSREDLVGKYFHLFVPPEENDTLKNIYEKATNEGLSQNVELKIRKKNKLVFVAEISTTLIQETDGTLLSFMLIIRDISQRKKTETKKLHADRMANLGEMASGMAHEINQPLNIISMVMDKILFETAKTEAINIEFLKDKSDKIFENIIRIRNIIDHVRAFSRIDDNYVLAAFDINVSIGNAVSMITEQFKHLGVRLNLKLDKQIPPIFGSTYKFEQVIVKSAG